MRSIVTITSRDHAIRQLEEAMERKLDGKNPDFSFEVTYRVVKVPNRTPKPKIAAVKAAARVKARV